VALPPNAFPDIEKSINADALNRQGITLEKREPLPLAAGKAFLMIGRQETPQIKLHKWIMVASAPELTAVITMQVPDDVAGTYPEEAIRSAFASLAVRASVPVEEQLGLVPFKLDELAGFRIGGVIAGRAVMLTDAAADVGGPTDDAQIVVAMAPGGPAQPADRDTFARDVFAAIPNLKDVRIMSSEPLRLGGQQGHQIMAQGKDATSGVDVTIVQWLRFGGGAYLQVIAVARRDAWTPAYARFRQVRDGVEPR